MNHFPLLRHPAPPLPFPLPKFIRKQVELSKQAELEAHLQRKDTKDFLPYICQKKGHKDKELYVPEKVGILNLHSIKPKSFPSKKWGTFKNI